MTRISKEKKQETRRQIIHVSKKLFFEKGYQCTSINQIAKTVGIAEGTIFNYFKTKADIFIETVLANSDLRFCSCDYTKDDLGLDVVEILMKYINLSINKLLDLPKTVLVELSIVLLDKAKSSPHIVKDLMFVDKKYIKKFVAFIKQLQKNDLIKECDANILAECIFSITMFELFIYLNITEQNKKDVIKRVENKVRVLINGYIC